jgi:HAD superfamily hydrolase (TIGR01484 family)
MIPKLVMFDLDGTLAESKQPITAPMSEALSALLAHTHAAIVSGGALAQLEKQAAARLPQDARKERLSLLPTSGAALFTYADGAWKRAYEERLTTKEIHEIEAAMREAAKETGLVDLDAPSYGNRIENRGAQVSFSALGQEAPIALKKAWDPDRAKRTALRAAVAAKLPGYLVAMGGTTTIDVTKRGIDKAYGLRKLAERLHIREADVLYVGDELVAGGNDEAVFSTNAQVRPVRDPEETRGVIVELLSVT